jgi:replication factor C large subunit
MIPMPEAVSWVEKYRPSSSSEILGNEETVAKFKEWLRSWTTKRKPAKMACLLVGPPGIGKTSLARAAANDLRFRIIEMNASDVRTEKAIEAVLGPARTSTTLDSFAGENRGNLILIDEVDGVFGREDRGGLGAILTVIHKSPVPIVLTANNTEDDRFVDLMKACYVIELYEIRPRLLVSLLTRILNVEGKTLSSELVDEVARTSHGDIRSAINDIQAIADTGSRTVGGRRTKEIDEKQTLQALFGNLAQARRAIDETEIPIYRDELLLMLGDILPYVYTTASKLAHAYDSLSRVDIGYGRINATRSRGMMPPPFNLPRRDTVPNWSLLPFVLNELATVGGQEPDEVIQRAIETAPRLSQKVPERYQYHLWQLDRLCSRVARACHVSKRTARQDIVPSLVRIFQLREETGREMAVTLGLEEPDIDFLISGSKASSAAVGPQQVLDPAGFKLPFMGKDKFIQLMRAGLNYDRGAGSFVVRHLENLNSIEERVGEIIGKPVKFARPEQPVAASQGDDRIIKECYIDGTEVPCAKCVFVEDCPTHTMLDLKFCLCDKSLRDASTYRKYVEKNGPIAVPIEVKKRAPKTTKPRRKRALTRT